MKLQGLEIDRSTTVDKVVAALKQAMFDGNINPGEQLREMTLSQTFSVSRSTVREALRVLTSDGFTVHSPNKGVMVRQLTLAEIDDIFLARSVLEIQAARAVKSCPESLLDALQAAMDNYAHAAKANDPLRAADDHIELHSVMAGLIGSKRLIETERSLMQDLQLVIATIDKGRDDLATEVAKHQRLTKLLLNRESGKAVELIRHDLALAKRFVIRETMEK